MKSKIKIFSVIKLAGAAIGFAICSLVYYISKFLLHPKVYSVIMKTCGIWCFILASSALVKWYASPVSAALAYMFMGMCGIFAKQSESKNGGRNHNGN